MYKKSTQYTQLLRQSVFRHNLTELRKLQDGEKQAIT